MVFYVVIIVQVDLSYKGSMPFKCWANEVNILYYKVSHSPSFHSISNVYN